MRVFADGRLEAKPWTDREGQVRAGLELVASDIEFMSTRNGPTLDLEDDQAAPVQSGRPMPERVAVGAGAGRSAPQQSASDDDLQDLPF